MVFATIRFCRSRSLRQGRGVVIRFCGEVTPPDQRRLESVYFKVLESNVQPQLRNRYSELLGRFQMFLLCVKMLILLSHQWLGLQYPCCVSSYIIHYYWPFRLLGDTQSKIAPEIVGTNLVVGYKYWGRKSYFSLNYI